MDGGFVDIHCHLLPGVDDGAADWETTLGMARMAVEDGTQTIIVTPHQLGNFTCNRGDDIRAWTAQLQQVLDDHSISLRVLPGGDVRIEDGMIELLKSGEILTLGDLHRHVLLELPHELYFPLEGTLAELKRIGCTGILSHPERNQGLLRHPELLPGLIEAGCLMQITAGSLMGTFGAASQQMTEWMLAEGLVAFVATDAHGTRSRRPLMQRTYHRVAELTDQSTADALCKHNPGMVATGGEVTTAGVAMQRRGGWKRLFTSQKVA